MEAHHERKVAMLQKLQSCTGDDQASMIFRLASNVTEGGNVCYFFALYFFAPLRMVDNLRVRGHVYNLPESSTSAHKKSFV